jgi:DNA-binding response OmpR family regulator
VESSEEEIVMYFDLDKMEQILTNVLANAFKFTPAGGEVRVAIRRLNPPLDTPAPNERREKAPSVGHASVGFVEVSVADTGIGIPEVEIPHVFDRFYQVDGSHTREQEGSGIGLALTKELVELHHGDIHVKSKVGKGTEIVLVFPLGREHLTTEEIVETPMETRRPGPASGTSSTVGPDQRVPDDMDGRADERPLVLVVEDNADVRAYVWEHLRQVYRILEAPNGAEGFQEAREQIPDLVISDVMMPGMDGYEFCRMLKLDEKTSHIPVILLTAKAGMESKLEGLETGADDYLTKPFETRELLARVKNLIVQRRKLRERFIVGQVVKPGEITVTSVDDAFLRRVLSIVEERMGDESFGVEDLARAATMSRSQLHRKLTALTNHSPTVFIRSMRLHRAMEMLKKNAGTVSDVAYAVGFGGVSYFSKCFQEQFGVLPSEVKSP